MKIEPNKSKLFFMYEGFCNVTKIIRVTLAGVAIVRLFDAIDWDERSFGYLATSYESQNLRWLLIKNQKPEIDCSILASGGSTQPLLLLHQQHLFDFHERLSFGICRLCNQAEEIDSTAHLSAVLVLSVPHHPVITRGLYIVH